MKHDRMSTKLWFGGEGGVSVSCDNHPVRLVCFSPEGQLPGLRFARRGGPKIDREHAAREREKHAFRIMRNEIIGDFSGKERVITLVLAPLTGDEMK